MVSFPAGPGGGHQLRNRSDAPARYLMLSQRRAPEIAVYPDSGKLGAADLPRGDEQGSFRHIFRIADAAGYWDDERPPED